VSLTVIVVTDDVGLVLWGLLLPLLTLVVIVAVVVVAVVVVVVVDLRRGLFLACLSLLLPLLPLLWWGVFEFSHLIRVHHLDLSASPFPHDPLLY